MRQELRKNPRRLMHRRRATIQLAQRVAAPCVVTDISDGGAKLGLTVDEKIPDVFMLCFQEHPKIERECLVVWRSQKHIGVRFQKRSSAGFRQG